MNAEDQIELSRLRKMFEDAGEGTYDVLALLDHYQRNAMQAEARLRAVRAVLEQNGCECTGAMCLACRVEDAIDGWQP